MTDNARGEQKLRLLLIEMSAGIRDDFEEIERCLAEGAPGETAPGVCRRSAYAIDRACGAEDAVEMVRQSMWDGEPYALAVADPADPPYWAGLEALWRLWLVDPELLVATAAPAWQPGWREAVAKLGRCSHMVPVRRPLEELEICHLAALGRRQREVSSLARLKRDRLAALADQRMRQTHQGDLAERKHLESELHRQRDFNKRLLQASSAYIIAVTPEGRVMTASDSLTTALGYATHEVVGMDWIALCLPEHERQRVAEALRSAAKGQGPVVMEIELVARNGEEVIVEWHAEDSSKRGEDSSLLMAVGINVTERRRAERELREHTLALEIANHRLEEMCSAAQVATWAKSEFLANMSHEIRTPMTAILGFAENLLLPDLTELDRAACVETIRRNGEHLMAIINDILDLSKIEAGKVEIETVACCPGRLAVDIHELMLDRARGKGLDFELRFANPLPAVIRSDPTRLRQILINLVGNAIKFTQSGRIGLTVGCTPETGRPSTIHFEVSDTGVGMTEEQLGRLFVPFSQADNSTTRRFGGTGLGLAISKRLIDRLGGSISVESTPAKGSTFRVVVPVGTAAASSMICSPQQLADPSEQPCQPPVSPLGSDFSCRVLLAEDTPDNQRLIRLVLSSAGAEVDIAEDGQIALDKAVEAMTSPAPYDLILMDIQMPNVDGYEATSRLRERGYDRPIVALTAHAMAGDRERCLQVGCDDFISKPVKREDLLAMVARYAQPRSVQPGRPR